jgi:hypothetical protein
MGGLAAEGRAEMITTPAGIGPGQSFIVAFLDYTTPARDGTAESSNIATYNAAITSAASVITYSGGTIGAWQIIAATATADPAAALFSSSLPVYGTTGIELATHGSTWVSTGNAPRYQANGVGNVSALVWTGLGRNGAPLAGETLGVTSGNIAQGQSQFAMNGAGLYEYDTPYNLAGQYYGFATFTVTPTPEPGTLTLSLMGLATVGAVRLVRRRRAALPPA